MKPAIIPTTPTTIRIQPTAWRSTPFVATCTANARIAPSAIKNSEKPRPIVDDLLVEFDEQEVPDGACTKRWLSDRETRVGGCGNGEVWNSNGSAYGHPESQR